MGGIGGGVQPGTLTPSSFSLKSLSEEGERGSCKNKGEVEEELLVGEVGGGGGGGEGGLSQGMITYVHCLSSEPVVSCWRRSCYEDAASDRRTLCYFQRKTTKMGNNQQAQAQTRSQYQYQARSGPRSEGCLRKRLLSASKVHQRPDSLWTPKPLLGPVFRGSSEATLTSKDSKGKRT